MRKFICALLVAFMFCASVLPTVTFADDTDQSPAQAEALAAFERFASLRLERGMEAALPGETMATGADGSVYEPFDGFVFKAIQSGGGFAEEWPMYICGSVSNDSFEESTLWTIFQDCMRAVEPALTEEVSFELMQELLYATGSIAEDLRGVGAGVISYGHWRFALIMMENGDEGPMMSVLPTNPQEEPKSTSHARLDAVYRRFRQTAEWKGLELAEDLPGEWDDSDPNGPQFNRVIAQGAWWMELYYGDVFIGHGISLERDSPLYGHLPNLFFALAVAVDPSGDPDEYDAMYEQLLAQAEESPDGQTSRLQWNDVQFLFLPSGEQLGLLALRQSVYSDQPQEARAAPFSAGMTYQRFRDACEEAGYALLPEEDYRLEDDSWYVWTPMAGLEWAHSLGEDWVLYFDVAADLDSISFDEAMPLFAIAARAVEPSWILEDARAYIDDLRAGLVEYEDKLANADSLDDIAYILMYEEGIRVSFTMLIMP